MGAICGHSYASIRAFRIERNIFMIRKLISFKNKVRRKVDATAVKRGKAPEYFSSGIKISHPDFKHTFCGYYDRSPWSPDGRLLLVCCVDAETLEDSDMSAHIYAYELSSGEFFPVAKTRCWNFQQGAQQQWCGEDQVLLNTEEIGQPLGRVYGVKRASEYVGEIPYSIGMLNRNKGLVALYDYGPMARYEHDYGYSALLNRNDSETNRENLKVTLWSFENSLPEKELGTVLLNEIDRDDAESRKGIRYIQHVKFNPSGTKILFVLS